MMCVYNPVTSRERTWATLEPAKQKKRVVVVGAGPAGMEAALVAHARSHEVIVFEKNNQVGGQVHLASKSPMRRLFVRIAEFYQRQADKAEFEIRLSSECTAASIRALAPDAVVVATGSEQRRVQLLGSCETWTVTEALTRNLSGIHNMLVVDYVGTMEALMLTDYLSDHGIEVEYITAADQAANTVEGMTREEMLKRLTGRSVRFKNGENLVYWKDKSALIRQNRFIEERMIEGVDAVVISAGANPVNRLALDLRGLIPEIYTIGDANAPRTVHEATLQGGLVGRML